MMRLDNRLWMLAGMFWLGLGCSLLAVDDTVYVRDKKIDKVNDVRGDITADTVAGIKIKTGTKVQDIPTSDIVRITYGDLPKESKLLYSSIMTAEDKKDETAAQKDYEGLLPKLSAAPKSKRQVEFRIAVLKAKLAQKPEEMTAATEALTSYVAKNPDGWQYSIAARQLARIQISAKNYEDAATVLEKLGKTPGLPKDVKNEVELTMIDVLISSNKLPDAETRIRDASVGLVAGDPFKERLDILSMTIDAKAKPEVKIAKLEQIINTTTDPSLKAIAYNALGDCYMKANKSRDAMWSYMWVDMVYNQDRSERLKALDRLSRYFEEKSDDERAKLYRDKIAELR